MDLTPVTDISSKQIIVLNIKLKVMKLLEENLWNKCANLWELPE